MTPTGKEHGKRCHDDGLLDRQVHLLQAACYGERLLQIRRVVYPGQVLQTRRRAVHRREQLVLDVETAMRHHQPDVGFRR